MKKLHFVTIGAAGIVLCGALHTAVAQSTPPFRRTFVSAAIGLDANSCQPTAPCRTFPRALSQTAVEGEVVVLDSGGYGSNIGITQAVAIEIPAGVYAGMSVLGGSGVTINTPASVRLRGLTLNSVAGNKGIQIVQAGAVSLKNITVNGFAEEGLLLQDDSILTIVDSAFKNNIHGIWIQAAFGTAQVTLERVTMHRNSSGSGLNLSAGASAVARDCIATGNYVGFSVVGGGSRLVIERALIAHANFFGYKGVSTSSGAYASIANSTITNVYTGLYNDPGALGTLVTKGSNNFTGNTADKSDPTHITTDITLH